LVLAFGLRPPSSRERERERQRDTEEVERRWIEETTARIATAASGNETTAIPRTVAEGGGATAISRAGLASV
jgi:hypothetical protein